MPQPGVVLGGHQLAPYMGAPSAHVYLICTVTSGPMFPA
jgi:hypothetical protein